MSIPNVIEEEEILEIDKDLNDSFKQIPVSVKTIKVWKGFLYDRDKKNYSDEQVITIIKDDPNPEEYEDKDQHNKIVKMLDENQRSDLVKCVILDSGGELEEYESVPVMAEFELEDV